MKVASLALVTLLLQWKNVVSSLSEDELVSAPVDAPSEDDLPGCRGMKLKKKDELQRPFPPMLVGKDYETSLGDQKNDANSYHVKNEAGPRAATCNGGFAAGYPCENVDLLSMLDVDELNAALSGQGLGDPALNDIWGWTDPSSKREFSIVGLNTGTAFVEITDPYNPIYLGALVTKTVASGWRDMKVIDHYALIVSEAASHGMQVFDLKQHLLTASPSTLWSAEDAHYNQFGNAHNIFVNEDSGFAYAVGSGTCNGGLHMIDVNDPMNPTFAGCFSDDGYVHDVQCVIYDGPDATYTNQEICFSSNEDTITIVDVTDKANPQELSRRSYPGDGYTHQGWLTEDKKYFIFNDELDEYYGTASKTRTHVMDVQNLNNISYIGYHNGRTSAIDHNNYVKDGFVYQANYRAGLGILEINDMSTATFDEAGYFDIFPNSNSANFNAAWSNYPYHESGVVTVSGVEQGLFVLKFISATTSTPTASPTNSPTTSPIVSTTAPVASTLAPVGSPTSSCSSCCEELTSQADNMENKIEAILDMMLQGSTPTAAPTSAPILNCTDRTGKWAIGGINRKWCNYASNSNTAQRCEDKNLFEDCPRTCKPGCAA